MHGAPAEDVSAEIIAAEAAKLVGTSYERHGVEYILAVCTAVIGGTSQWCELAETASYAFGEESARFGARRGLHGVRETMGESSHAIENFERFCT